LFKIKKVANKCLVKFVLTGNVVKQPQEFATTRYGLTAQQRM